MASIDIKALLGQVRKAPRALRVIAIIAAVDLVILLYAILSLSDGVDDSALKITQLNSDLSGFKQQMESTRKEIGQLPELRKLYDAALASGVLAGQDRLKFVTLAQDLVKAHRLSDFRFKLAPEVASPLPNSKYQLSSTDISLDDTGIVGSDVFAFWEEILKRSQAHFQITEATIQRDPASSLPDTIAKIKAGSPVAPIKAELKFRWQSMRLPSETKAAVPAKTAGAAASASAPTPPVVPAPAPAPKGDD